MNNAHPNHDKQADDLTWQQKSWAAVFVVSVLLLIVIAVNAAGKSAPTGGYVRTAKPVDIRELAKDIDELKKTIKEIQRLLGDADDSGHPLLGVSPRSNAAMLRLSKTLGIGGDSVMQRLDQLEREVHDLRREQYNR
jgi:hypothetical protein